MSVAIVLAGCDSDPFDELAGESASDDQGDLLEGKADAADGVYTYFSISSDLRDCAWPACGGFFLDRLNRSTTECPGGEWQEACYTPELDWTKSGLDLEQQAKLLHAAIDATMSPSVHAIVRGWFVVGSTSRRPGELSRFVVTEAWVGTVKGESNGVFVKVADNGIMCVRAPCPSLTETALNTSRRADISDLDFSSSGLSLQEQAMVEHDLFTPSGLIVAGDRYIYELDAVEGKGRTVSAAYHRLASTASPCYVGGCSAQVCSEIEGAASTCEWREEYSCYQAATCERQSHGACGWTETPELMACVASAR